MARKKATGRFDTREELVQHVLFLELNTSCSAAQIARNVHVSETTVANIVKSKQ